MLLATFGEIADWTKFIYKYTRFIKIPQQHIKIESCCNFTRNSLANAKSEDGQYSFFNPDEQIIIRP